MRNIIVYDNFYKDPDEIRKWALNSEWLDSEKKTYPGLMSKPLVAPEVPNLFRSIVGTDIYYRNENQIGWFGEFRLSHQGDQFEQWIHSDPTAPWACVVFMNPNPPSDYGTAFWVHKETGSTKVPMLSSRSFPTYDTKTMSSMGYNSWEDMQAKMVYQDGLDATKWDLDIFVPGKYNRAIIFNPQLWHSHMPKNNFGTNNEDSRLVQLFFFGSKS